MNDISSHELYLIDCSCWLSLCGLLVFYLVSIVPIFTVGITLLCFGMYPKYERSILISLNLTRVAYSLNDV